MYIILQDTNAIKSNDDECAITTIADLIFIIFSAVLYLMYSESEKSRIQRVIVLTLTKFSEICPRFYDNHVNFSITTY